MPERASRTRSRIRIPVLLHLFLPVIVIIPVLLAAACSRPDSRLIEIDGVLHVRNPAEPSRPDMGVGFEPLFTIGSADGEEATVFSAIGALGVAPEGSICLLDYRSFEVRVFTSEGEFSHAFGNRGQGPGEFDLVPPGGMSLDQAGRVWIADIGRNRIVIHTLGGELIRTIAPTTPIPEAIRPGTAGYFGIVDSSRPAAGGMEIETTWRLIRYSAEGDSLGEIMSSRVIVNPSDMQSSVLIAAEPLYAQAPDGRLWQGRRRTDAYAFTIWTPEGECDRVVEVAAGPVRKSEEEIAREEAMFERIWSMLPERPADLEMPGIDPLKPYFSTLAVDPRGLAWVLLYRSGSAERTAFDLFSPEGFYLRRVEVPVEGSIEHAAIGTDRAYFAGVDADGVPMLFAFDLTIDF